MEERIAENQQAERTLDALLLQRIWRDVHATSQHLGLQFEFAMESYGRTLVGLPSGSLM